MNRSRRIALLALFAAVGVGIAVAVVVATSPRSATSTLKREATHWTAQQPIAPPAASAPEPVPRNNEAQPKPQPLAPAPDKQADVTPAVPTAPLSIPVGAVLAEPHPQVAFQADADEVRKAIEYLQKRLGPTSTKQPESIPAPAPAPLPAETTAQTPVDKLAPSPAIPPEPALTAAPSTAGATKPATMARKSRITHASPGEGDDHLIMRIQDTDIREVLEMLSEEGNLNILASNSVQGKVSATLNDVNIDDALTAILRSTGFISRRDGKFIYVGTPDDFEAMEHAVDSIGTRVYRPNYITAEDLKTLITPLMTPKIGLSSVSAPAEMGIATDDDKVGGNTFAGGEAVVVRDYEAVLAQIDQVVAEIDIRPMQVAIEAMILSVKLNDINKFGVSFQLLRDQPNLKFGWGTPLAKIADVDFTKGGLKFGFLDGNLGAFISALESIGDTNVVATPRTLVLNKHRADILIGREDGYISTTQTETARTQTVEFLDIGAQLRIRPFVSSDGLIRMEVHPELSDGQVREMAGFTVPYKDVTKVTTNIMVRDGSTVVIGGLMREVLQTTTTQVPFLGSLPVVGVAFRDVQEETKREEVLILITPRIVDEPETSRDGLRGSGEFLRRQAVYAEKMSALGKRHVARCYLRKAKEAWTRGETRSAMRFVEMAVHFDPDNLEAIELRSRIWTSGCDAAPNIPPLQAVPNAATPLDGQAIAPWLLEGLESSDDSLPSGVSAEPQTSDARVIQPRTLP